MPRLYRVMDMDMDIHMCWAMLGLNTTSWTDSDNQLLVRPKHENIKMEVLQYEAEPTTSEHQIIRSSEPTPMQVSAPTLRSQLSCFASTH